MAFQLRLETCFLPIVKRRRRRNEGQVVASESADVITGAPQINLGLHQDQCQWQSDPANSFGQANDIGLDAGPLETEECASTAAAHLDVIDDQDNTGAPREFGQPPNPVL